MIEILKAKLNELEERKEKLRGNFSEYELPEHLNVYIELQGIDYAIKTIRDIIISELEKNYRE